MINKTTTIRILTIMVIFLSVAGSCGGEKEIVRADLNLALRLSGENRAELEKVLSHYSDNEKDTLKLRAAEFLICNMLYHRSMCGECIENQIKISDTLYSYTPLSFRSVYYMIPARLDSLKEDVQTEPDIEKISADFLIKNIDYSFDAWGNSVYEPKISFEDFCEYILPYKHSQEPLILWKDSTDSKNETARDFNTYEVNLSMANTYHLYKNLHQYYMPYMRLLADKTLYSASDNVEHRAYMDLAFMRSKGLPVVIDFVPFANPNDNNYWVAIIDRKHIDNNYARVNVNFSSKVFRKTYSLNPTPDDKDNFIPEFLRNPYIKDVTPIYQNTTTVEYDFGDVSSGVKYAYLSVFYDGEWREVAWAEIKNGKVLFENMGRDVVYMPLYYSGNEKICAHSAIHVDRNGEVANIGTTDNEKLTIALERVSVYDISGEYFSRNIIGGKIITCNILENLKFDTLATITHSKYNNFDTVNVNSDKKYKCWLFTLGLYAYLSELQFFDKTGQQVQGQIVWLDSDKKISYEPSVYAKLFDNNVLTSSGMNCTVGILLKEPVAISYVKYMPQNDRCGIIPGNEYELCYFQNGEWVSLAKKVATDYKIEFSDVPARALFWLHDKGKKCDERPFTIVNGRIKFW